MSYIESGGRPSTSAAQSATSQPKPARRPRAEVAADLDFPVPVSGLGSQRDTSPLEYRRGDRTAILGLDDQDEL